VDGFMLTSAASKVRHVSGKAASNLVRPVVEEFAPGGLGPAEVTHLCRQIKHRLAFVVDSARVYASGREDEEYREELSLGWRGEQLEFEFDAALLDVGEVFFNPKQVLDDQDDSIVSVSEMICRSLKHCSSDVRRALVGNIVLCGGSTLLAGFAERLANDVQRLLPHLKSSVKVRADRHRRCAAWTGGAVLASIEATRWVSKW
jgi:hypothetical protein